MDATEITQESGVPVGAQPAAQGGMPPGAPVDPATAAADPMAGMAAQAPQSIEEMAAAGDPISTAFVEMKQKLNLAVEILMTIADHLQLQMPASQSFQSKLKDIEKQVPKAAEFVIDDDDDEPVSSSRSMGVVATMSRAGNKFLAEGSGAGLQPAGRSHWLKVR